MKKNYTLLYLVAALLCSTNLFSQATHLNFDGSDDHAISTNAPTTNTENQTYEAWFKIPALPANDDRILQRGSDASGGWSLALSVNPSGNIWGGIVNSGTGISITGTTVLTPNTWYHATLVLENSASMRLYLNGNLEASTNITAINLRNSGNRVRVGQGNVPSEYFNGDIDEVRVWNTARTVTEINDNKDCELLGSETGLVTYYQFNQGTAGADNTSITALNDSAGTNTGTILNFSLTGSSSNFLAGSTITSLPTVSFTAPNDVGINDGIQAGLGGGTPTGGVYSGSGVIDDGNGTTYTFNPSTAGVGIHTITYTYTDGTCSASASDDIEVSLICDAPTAVRDQNATATTTTIIFESAAAVGSEYTADYEVAGSGASTQVTGTTTAGSTAINLTGLTAETAYTISIKVKCSPTVESAPTVYNFTTVFPDPQTVNFQGYDGNNLTTVFSGWTEGKGASTPTITNSFWFNSNTTQTTAFGNIATARINLYTTNREEWIVSPRIIATTGSVLDYKVAVTNWNTASSDTMGPDDFVKVMLSNNGGYTWTELEEYTATDALSNTLTQQSISLSAYAGQTIQIAFFAKDGPVNDPEDYDFHVADVFLGETCAAPTAQATAAIFGTQTSASIALNSFTAPTGGADGYVVKINSTNTFTAPTDGALPSASLAYAGGEQVVYAGTSDSPMITVTGLSENTQYYFQVYAYNDCAGVNTFETTGFNTKDFSICSTTYSLTNLPVADDNTVSTDLLYIESQVTITGQLCLGGSCGTDLDQIDYWNIRDGASGPMKFDFNTPDTRILLREYSDAARTNNINNIQLTSGGVSEVELNSGTYYTAQVELLSVQPTVITYNITLYSPALSCDPPCFAPEQEVTSPTFGTSTENSITLTGFTAPTGGANGYVIYFSDTNSFVAPNNDDTPTADTSWNNAGQQPIYFGTSIPSSLEVTGLDELTTYYFQIYPYNNCFGEIRYGNGTNTNNTTTNIAICGATTIAIPQTTITYGTFDNDGIVNYSPSGCTDITFKMTDDGLSTAFATLTGINGSLNRGFKNIPEVVSLPFFTINGLAYESDAGDAAHGIWYTFATDNGADFELTSFVFHQKETGSFNKIEVIGFKDGMQTVSEEFTVTANLEQTITMTENAFKEVDEIRVRQKTTGFYDAGAPGFEGMGIGDIVVDSPTLGASQTLSEEEFFFNSVAIYPNPSHGLVNINLGELNNINIKVYSTLGKLVYAENDITNQIHQFKLNTSQGVYFIKVNSENKTKTYKLILK